MVRFKIAVGLLFLFLFSISNAQKTPDYALIQSKIEAFKKDAKGPYQQIMWFCPDGSRVPPKERCPDIGGVQRATYKTWVELLARDNHIFLGQILAATNDSAFLDEKNQFSQLKQYQLENYLERIDNGWILQKAKYYRGAFQDEDENSWGGEFLKWVLTEKKLEQNNFFLLRQAFKDIPHKADNQNIRKVRSLSMEIAVSEPSFMNLRIKIHGQPEIGDIQQVKDFKKKNTTQLSDSTNIKLDQLVKEMTIMFQPANWQLLDNYIKNLGATTTEGKKVQEYLSQINSAVKGKQKLEIVAHLLLDTRKMILAAQPKSKKVLFDLSNKTEELFFRELSDWNPADLNDLLQTNYILSMSAAGCGFLELWEWEKIEPVLKVNSASSISVDQLNDYLATTRSVVEWSTAMIHANYAKEIGIFEKFEPMILGYSDDLVRSSVLLHLGQNVGLLGKFIATNLSLTNQVFKIENQGQLRGLNPGFAKGELVVANSLEGLEVSADKIYVFQQPPSDLKPVAGIATVSEGNLVSHVQLLARNLAIPNAVLSQQNLNSLKEYSGKQVFYAISNSGTVIMKLAENMTPTEKALFEVKKRANDKIRVDIDKMDLKRTNVLNLRDVNAASSGKICGPKAANLGQLKLMFPVNVVEGIVISFGIFKKHMEQKMPGENQSYWEFLNNIFRQASSMEKDGSSKTDVDNYILKKLETLRDAIQKMPFIPEFEADLKKQFQQVLGKEMGKLPVFLRSDTNMEDLKDFTGAGLNLTLFNVVEPDKIMQGIKQVWASPYSERSFRWRQSYLLNPENVFPSILVIPSVNVDYSGVLITKGLNSGENENLTVAFSRGAGGAVDGQAAETYLLKSNGENKLLAPSREPLFNSLPVSGGTGKLTTNFDSPILNAGNLDAIWKFAGQVKQKMKETNGMQGPYDIELGFQNNKLWLFQVRPFVENKNAASALYLESITPVIDGEKQISLTQKL